MINHTVTKLRNTVSDQQSEIEKLKQTISYFKDPSKKKLIADLEQAKADMVTAQSYAHDLTEQNGKLKHEKREVEDHLDSTTSSLGTATIKIMDYKKNLNAKQNLIEELQASTAENFTRATKAEDKVYSRNFWLSVTVGIIVIETLILLFR